jgi:TPR repeat protein
MGTRGSVGIVPRVEGEASMARFEIAEVEAAALGANTSADVFFELGMMYSTGRSVPTDFVTAHKWFNIAAMRGNREAVRHRRELAAEMSETDIAAAQRAARDWLQAKVGAAEHRAAA